MKRIVVTGASGFVGRKLVPLLTASGAQLLLVGRDLAHLEALFPGLPACGYEVLAARGAGYDLLVHLATINTDSPATEAEFDRVNRGLLVETAERAAQAGIRCFVNISSIHALDPADNRAYASSKRAGARALEQVAGIEARTLYLPAVYADEWSGRLAPLNALPAWAVRGLFTILSALRPVVHVSRLSAFLLDEPETDSPILSDGQEGNIVYRGVRGGVDLAFALAVAVFFWWALLLIWLLVRLESPGPGIFAQPRVGRNGRAFVCYKFRTMRQGTPERGSHEIGPDAVTPLGRFLRRTKLDELPQIWNILRNEISLVGPRPCLPAQTRLIEERRRRGVLRLKPGISGLAQINGVDMADPERLARLDARYLALQSLTLDLRIILATFRGRGRGDGVRHGQS